MRMDAHLLSARALDIVLHKQSVSDTTDAESKDKKHDSPNRHFHPPPKSIALGSVQLSRGIAMAPLTQHREDRVAGVPSDDAVESRSQRASSGGLILTEANVASQRGGSPGAPRIFTQEQADAWKRVNDAVRAKGGVHCCQ